VPDALFSDSRLAELYDPLDPDRSDLAAYAAMADEFGARSVLDVGCGTGTLACLLAGRGLDVTAADPARASLEVARRKPGADRVRWLHADAASLPPLRVDLAFMTVNVAQVFVSDQDWAAALAAIKQALRPDGQLVFETRDPARKAWLEWTPEQTWRRVAVPAAGPVVTWTDLTATGPGLVSFLTTFVFDRDGTTLTSHSTLRFRDRAELTSSLATAGLTVSEVRDAPDRPGREFVFITRQAPGDESGRLDGTLG
jgi:SAM-dependent methyltransferase